MVSLKTLVYEKEIEIKIFYLFDLDECELKSSDSLINEIIYSSINTSSSFL